MRNPWTTVGDIKSLVTCGDVRILHNFPGDKENSDDLYWGIETWEASTGEMRPTIFDLLGNNSMGRMFILWKGFQELELYANTVRNYPKLLSGLQDNL